MKGQKEMATPLSPSATPPEEASPPADKEEKEGQEKSELRYQIRFSASKEFMEKFYKAQALLVSKYGRSVNTEDIMEEALELFLEKKSPTRRQERRALREKNDAPSKQNMENNNTGEAPENSNAAPRNTSSLLF